MPSRLQNLVAMPYDSNPPGHLSMSMVPGCVLAHITPHMGSVPNGHPLNAVLQARRQVKQYAQCDGDM